MHHGTYAVNQTGLTWQTELVSNLYFEPVVQLTWIGSKYSIEPGSILYVEPVVLLEEGPTIVNLTFSNS